MERSFFSSHEALHLHYEQALTRRDTDGHWYNFSTHLPWVGLRTATKNSAHLEFLRGVQNPIGFIHAGRDYSASKPATGRKLPGGCGVVMGAAQVGRLSYPEAYIIPVRKRGNLKKRLPRGDNIT